MQRQNSFAPAIYETEQSLMESLLNKEVTPKHASQDSLTHSLASEVAQDAIADRDSLANELWDMVKEMYPDEVCRNCGQIHALSYYY